MAIILVPGEQARSSRIVSCDVTLSRVVHAKVALCYVNDFRDAGVSPEFAKALWDCYKLDGIDMKKIIYLKKTTRFYAKFEY